MVEQVGLDIMVVDGRSDTSTVTEVTVEPTRVLREDLNLLTSWAKDVLFETVKLVPNPEKYLAVNEYIYSLFLSDCGHKLAGLRRPEAVGEYRKMYCEMLWLDANRSKDSNIMKILTGCRSTVYSAAKNRFGGK